MKKCTYLILFGLLFMVSCFPVFGQVSYEYTYDDSGNRITRNVIHLSKAQIDDQDFSVDNIDGKLIRIYPNPTKGFLKIEIPHEGEEYLASIKAYTINGRLIANKETAKEVYVLDLHDQPSGIYMLKIQIGNKMADWKIIKE